MNHLRSKSAFERKVKLFFENENVYIYKPFAKRKCFRKESKMFSKRKYFYLRLHLKTFCIF